MSKNKAKSNVETLDTQTVEFTQGEMPKVNEAESFNDLDASNSAYHDLMKRNELFASSGAAIAAFKAWSTNDKYSLAFIDRAVKEALVKFGMHKIPEQANAAPLTHAVLAMQHRGKKNLASKCIAFVMAITNYKWDAKKDCFRLKANKAVNTAFTPEQQAIFDRPFYEYVKPTVKTEWDLQHAIELALNRADNKGISQEERAAIIARFASGNTPKTVKVAEPTIRNDLKTEKHAAKVDVQANTKDAA